MPPSSPAPNVTEAGTPAPMMPIRRSTTRRARFPSAAPTAGVTRRFRRQIRSTGRLVPGPERGRLRADVRLGRARSSGLGREPAGHVLHWNGATWSVESSPAPALRSVWGTSARDIWIAGESGLVLTAPAAPNALAFARVSIAASQTIAKVWGTSPTDIWRRGRTRLSSHLRNRPASLRLRADGDRRATTATPTRSVQSDGALGIGERDVVRRKETDACAPTDC